MKYLIIKKYWKLKINNKIMYMKIDMKDRYALLNKPSYELSNKQKNINISINLCIYILYI